MKGWATLPSLLVDGRVGSSRVKWQQIPRFARNDKLNENDALMAGTTNYSH
jgi:hypothetical protein